MSRGRGRRAAKTGRETAGESERMRNRRPAAAPAWREKQEMLREKRRRRANIQSSGVCFPPMRCCRLLLAIARKRQGKEGRLRRSRSQGFLRGWIGRPRNRPGRASLRAEREGAAAARGPQRWRRRGNTRKAWLRDNRGRSRGRQEG